jgi:nucleoside phosphorylase
VLLDEEYRNKLVKMFPGYEVFDMESYSVYRTCKILKKKFYTFKIVSDLCAAESNFDIDETEIYTMKKFAESVYEKITDSRTYNNYIKIITEFIIDSILQH